MSVENFTIELSACATVLVLGIVWFVRLESKVLNSEKTLLDTQKIIDKLELRIETLDNRIFEKLSYIERSLENIKGRLSIESHKGDPHELR